MRSATSVIRWETPPPAKHRVGQKDGHSSYAELADELRANPGRWALVADRPGSNTGLATHIRTGSIQCFTPAGDFEAESRRVDGRSLVYARFLGGEPA